MSQEKAAQENSAVEISRQLELLDTVHGDEAVK